jgi:hypothetical protein
MQILRTTQTFDCFKFIIHFLLHRIQIYIHIKTLLHGWNPVKVRIISLLYKLWCLGVDLGMRLNYNLVAATVSRYSAVCWLYGKYLSQHFNYPIGLVDTDWGGTRIEAWSSPDALSACSGTSGRRKRWAN